MGGRLLTFTKGDHEKALLGRLGSSDGVGGQNPEGIHCERLETDQLMPGHVILGHDAIPRVPLSVFADAYFDDVM